MKVDFKYSPVHVDSDKPEDPNHGHLILDVAHLGNIEVSTGQDDSTLRYVAREVHFNGPSEHKLDGARHDMEMQIIHELCGATDQKAHEHTAIVSVLFKRAEEGHHLIDTLIHSGGTVDFQQELFDKLHGFYYYRGTHTAPPSVDFVNWFVLSKVLPVTAKQMAFIQDHWHESHGFTNYRITQPLYGRKVSKNF